MSKVSTNFLLTLPSISIDTIIVALGTTGDTLGPYNDDVMVLTLIGSLNIKIGDKVEEAYGFIAQ